MHYGILSFYSDATIDYYSENRYFFLQANSSDIHCVPILLAYVSLLVVLVDISAKTHFHGKEALLWIQDSCKKRYNIARDNIPCDLGYKHRYLRVGLYLVLWIRFRESKRRWDNSERYLFKSLDAYRREYSLWSLLSVSI